MYFSEMATTICPDSPAVWVAQYDIGLTIDAQLGIVAYLECLRIRQNISISFPLSKLSELPHRLQSFIFGLVPLFETF
jgi:hypothetical protein